MKPGRELDALIAEKVMGWEDNMRGLMAYAIVPNYSTDIAAAWKVIEELRKDQKALLISQAYQGPYWEYLSKVEWNDSLKGYRFEFATSISAPHAICLAALKAVGVNYETRT